SCISFRLATTPASRNTSFLDAYGNWAHQFNILREHRALTIEAESVVLTHDDLPATPSHFTLLEFDEQRGEFYEENYDFIAATEYVPHIPQLAEIVELAERECDGTVAGFSQAASQLIHQRFQYVKGATHVHSSIEDSLSLGAGVCQDRATTNPRWRNERALRPSRIEIAGLLIELKKREMAGGGGQIIVRQNHRLCFDRQGAMLSKDVELVSPISIRVEERGVARSGRRGQAEGDAALPVVLDGAQPNLVVAFGNRTVVVKFRDVHQMVPVHATTA